MNSWAKYRTTIAGVNDNNDDGDDKSREAIAAEVAPAPAQLYIAMMRSEKRSKENIKCGIYWELSSKKTEKGRQAVTHTHIEVEEKRIKSFSLLFISTISAEQCIYVYIYLHEWGDIFIKRTGTKQNVWNFQ